MMHCVIIYPIIAQFIPLWDYIILDTLNGTFQCSIFNKQDEEHEIRKQGCKINDLNTNQQLKMNKDY